MKLEAKNSLSIQSKLERFRKKIKNSTSHVKTNLAAEELITSIVGSESAFVWIYDQRRLVLESKRDETRVREISTLSKQGVIYKAFMTKEPRIYKNVATEIEYDEENDNPDSIKMKSKIILPLIDNGRLIGVATAYSSLEWIEDFSEYSLNLFKSISLYIIDAIHNMRGYEGGDRRKIQKTQDIALKAKELEDIKAPLIETDDSLKYMASVVHDIRTPANSLYGFLDLLEEQIKDVRLKEFVQNAKDSASFINELTTSILDSASGKNIQSMSQSDLINSALFFSKISEIFVSNMNNKRIIFNVFIDPKMPKEIMLDTLKLKRVLMNLIGNAYKFTPKNECIEFSVRYKPKDKKLHIFVKDSGIGIAKEKQNEIFEAFKQAEEDTNEKYGGNGLGLSICAAYVKELGGELRIDSNLGEGSTFYFDLPLESLSREKIFKPIKNSSAKISILLNNSNGRSANNIVKYLVRMGINRSNVNAIKSLEKIDESCTHLIVYQSKYTPELLSYCKDKSIELMVVEEELFSIDSLNASKDVLVISQYSYFADLLYTFIDVNSMPRVLIVDDDRIGISLLKNILDSELCRIETARDGESALELIELSLKNNNPYSLIYLDNFMPMISGDEVVNTLRVLERENMVKKAYVVSISGDFNHGKNSNYDSYANKPFETEQIREAFRISLTK